MVPYYIHYIYYLHLKERINFNIIRQKNNDAFKAKFVAIHLVFCTSFSMPETILHYIEGFNPAKKGFLATFYSS